MKFSTTCSDEGSYYCVFIAWRKKKSESVTHILYSSDVGGGIGKRLGYICYSTMPGRQACCVIHAGLAVVVSVDFLVCSPPDL